MNFPAHRVMTLAIASACVFGAAVHAAPAPQAAPARAETAYLSQVDAFARSARIANVDYVLDFTLTGKETFAGTTTVTFDLDGLMFNTEELYQEVGGVILQRRGKQITGDLLDQMMGRKSFVALQVMIDWHQLDDTPAGLAAESAEIFVDLLPARLAPMPGLVDLLAALDAAGVRTWRTDTSGDVVVVVREGEVGVVAEH